MRLHQRLYNVALEQRVDAYRRCGKSINYYDQAKELTQRRAELPEYGALNAQSEQVLPLSPLLLRIMPSISSKIRVILESTTAN